MGLTETDCYILLYGDECYNYVPHYAKMHILSYNLLYRVTKLLNATKLWWFPC